MSRSSSFGLLLGRRASRMLPWRCAAYRWRAARWTTRCCTAGPRPTTIGDAMRGG